MLRFLSALSLLVLLGGCATTEAEKQTKIRKLFDEAAQEEGRKDYREARDRYSDIIEINPEHARAYFKRGTAYAREKRYKEALADLTRAIELHRLYTAALYNRAEVYRAMWNADQANESFLIKAMEDYRRTIDINRNHPKAHKKLAFLLALWPQKRYKHLAIHHYRRHIKVVRIDGQAERWLDKLLREYGDPRELEKQQKAGTNGQK